MKQLNKWYQLSSSNYYYPHRETPKRVVGLFISVPKEGAGQVRIVDDLMYSKSDLDIVLADVDQDTIKQLLMNTIFTRKLHFEM